MKNIGLSFKIGIFVLLALIALGYMTVKITKYKRLLVMKGYEVHAIFDDASGLKTNNSVYIAGVWIGRVKTISLTKDGKADVAMIIKPSVRITKDAQARIRGHGMVGTKFVEIIQGVSPESIKPSGVIRNTVSVANIDQTINKVNPILDAIDDYLKSEKESLKEATENLKKVSYNMNDLLEKINKGQGTLGKLINDDEVYAKLKDQLDRLDNIIAKVENGQGTFGRLINDDTLYNDISKIVADIKEGKGTLGKLIKDEEFYNQARDTLDRINNMVRRTEAGHGTLGKLIVDESLYKEAKDAIRDIRKTSETVKEQTPISVIGTAVGVAR